MRFFLLMSLYGLVALGVETTWLGGWPTRSVHFDFIIIAVASLSFSRERKEAVPVLIFFGFISDSVSHSPFGMSVFSYLSVYLFIRAIIAKISFQGGASLLFWVGVVSLVDKAARLVVLLAGTWDVGAVKILLNGSIGQALLDACLGLCLVPFIGWYSSLTWDKLKKPRGIVIK